MKKLWAFIEALLASITLAFIIAAIYEMASALPGSPGSSALRMLMGI